MAAEAEAEAVLLDAYVTLALGGGGVGLDATKKGREGAS